MTRVAGFIVLFIFIACLNVSCGNRSERHYDGYIEGDNSYIASPFGGKLIVLSVHRGDRVKKNQKLFVLDDDPERIFLKQVQFDLLQARKTYDDLVKPRRTQEIDAIEAQIKQAKAEAELAAIRMKRYERLYQSKASDKDTYDAAVYHFQNKSQIVAQYEANLALARLGARQDQINAQKALVQSLQEKMMNAQWALAQKTAYAPADGMIIDTLFNQGEYVANQAPVVSFLSPDNTYVQFYVPLWELNQLKLGDKLYFTALDDKKRFEAVISFIAEEAEFVPPVVYSRDNIDHLVFRVQARFNPSALFKPGQPVIVYLS